MRKVFVFIAVVATMFNGYFTSYSHTNSHSELDVNDVEIPAEAESEVEEVFPWTPVVLTLIVSGYCYYKSTQVGTIYKCNGTVTDPTHEHYGDVDWECVEKHYTDRITCSPIGHHEYPPSMSIGHAIDPNNFYD